jgi:FkbM family methyltransferase
MEIPVQGFDSMSNPFWRPYSSRAILVRKVIPDIHWTIDIGDGLRMRASLKKHLIFFRRNYLRKERSTAHAISAHVPSKGTIYDIGANIGLYTLLFAQDRGKRVVSFEPSESVLPLLARNIELNDLRNVEVQPVLLSNYTGKCRFTLDTVTTCASHVSAQNEPGQDYECWDLDSYILEKHLPAPDVIKLDVEGHEMQILEGMKQTLERHRPIVYLESGVRNRTGEITAVHYLQSLGFSIWDVTKTRRVSANTPEYDFLAVSE